MFWIGWADNVPRSEVFRLSLCFSLGGPYFNRSEGLIVVELCSWGRRTKPAVLSETI